LIATTTGGTMTPCEENGWKVGQIFERVIAGDPSPVEKGSLVVLVRDDNTMIPVFLCLSGSSKGREYSLWLSTLTRVYPPEEKKTVTVVCEGHKVEISRESAKALNLIP